MADLPDPDNQERGYFADVFGYSAQLGRLTVNHGIFGDTESPGIADQDSKLTSTLNKQVGEDAIKQEHYDRLMLELRSGAGGELLVGR